METIEFSVITTVLNEAKTIKALLDSLAKQTLAPKEIVITDAGSTDGTITIINQWRERHKEIPVRLVGVPTANRSQGRNRAITEAKQEYLAVIDAGCTAESHWLARLAKTYQETGAEAVAGFYLTRPKNIWERIFSLYLAVQPKDFDPKTYLPSSRSLSLTKTAWKKAGKYPEKLNTCEDLVLAQRLKAKTKMVATAKACVYWQLPRTGSEFFKAIAGYAQGDVEARYRPHLIKMLTVYGRYLVFIVAPWLFLLYLLYPQFKFIRVLPLPDLCLTSVVQIMADVAVMWGGIKGGLSQNR
ncbi:hypothetical protein A2W24_01595 [Microgenomates group bacterium RBG_16_45_19]|nr:MAG: hypothetical protein A2W24_01595 [Microgenomates group bacterium RBG_16_45_19]